MGEEPEARALSLGAILLWLRANSEAFADPSCRGAADLRELWMARIHRAYAASRWELLEVLVLNRAVAHAAPSRSRQAEEARANVARTLCRLGVPPAEACWRAAPGEERAWLRWLCLYRSADPQAAAAHLAAAKAGPDREAEARWCCLLHPEGNFGVLTEMTQTAGSPNTPAGLRARLCAEQAAAVCLAHKDWAAGAQWAERAGEDATVLRARALRQMGTDWAAIGVLPAHRAQRAVRAAARCRRLGFGAEAERWEAESRLWEGLAAGLESA
jgi:hypothetical protein